MASTSIVIPLFNKRDSVRRSLESVLSQTVSDFELVVVDDGSSDGSGEVVEAMADPRIRLVRQPNLGVSVARNRGILEARGTHIAFLDADDEWHPRFLEVLLGIFAERPRTRVAVAAWQIVQEGRTLQPFEDLFTGGAETVEIDFFEQALRRQPLHPSAVVVDRSLFAEAGVFPPGITHGEDLDTWFRIGLACGRDDIVMTNRTHALWHTTAENRAGMRRARAQYLPTVEWVLADPGAHGPAVREFAYHLLILQARRLHLSGRRLDSLRRIWRARRTRRHRRGLLKQLAKTLFDPRVLPGT